MTKYFNYVYGWILYLAWNFPILFFICFSPVPNSATSLEAQAVAESNGIFANSVYNILQIGLSDNFVFSPFGLSVGIWMLTAGARGNTREEVKNGLNLGKLDEANIAQGYSDILNTYDQNLANNSSTHVIVSNHLFVSRRFDLKYEFVSTLQNIWKSNVKSVNFSVAFETVSSIDEWVAKSSNHKLKSLFKTENLEEDLSSVLVGIANVGGPWKMKFARNSIREKPFFINENERVRVQMMTSDDYFRHGDVPELDSTAIFLPLEEDRFGLLVLLPNRRTGLARTAEKLRDFPFLRIIGRLRRKWVELSLPKFKIESTFDFVRNGLLSKLGIRSILYETAEFSGVSCQPGVHISQFLQSSLLELNEEGLDGTPPTFTKINSLKPTSRQSVRFYADHPFLIFVYDQLTRTILLIAQKIN